MTPLRRFRESVANDEPDVAVEHIEQGEELVDRLAVVRLVEEAVEAADP